MSEPIAESKGNLHPSSEHLLTRRSRLVFFALLIYVSLAYLMIPAAWRKVESRHPSLGQLPTIARTHDNIPGDPLNIALIGTEERLMSAMLSAGWHPADPLTWKSSLRIAGDTVLHRPYVDAPVSNLFLWGRKQDLAFEQPVGHDPRQRHHARFWHSAELDSQGRPLWIGGATFDVKVGISHTTGQITHHIRPDVDTERDKILGDLKRVHALSMVVWRDGFQPHLKGHNGGGDPYHTDGRLPIGILSTQ